MEVISMGPQSLSPPQQGPNLEAVHASFFEHFFKALRLAWPLAAAMAALALAGCVSASLVSSQENSSCEYFDWFEIGRVDGVGGEKADKISDYRARCDSTAHPVNQDLYTNGYNAGLIEFCTPTNGYDLGRRGETYGAVCPFPMEEKFLEHYKIGLRVNQLQNENSDLEARIENLIRSMPPDRQNYSVRSQIDQLRSRRAKNESEIDSLERE